MAFEFLILKICDFYYVYFSLILIMFTSSSKNPWIMTMLYLPVHGVVDVCKRFIHRVAKKAEVACQFAFQVDANT